MNRFALRCAAGALAVFLVAGALAHASLELPPKPLGRVSDFAGFLTPGGAARIDQLIASHEAESGDQIAVAIFPSLDGDEIADVGIRLADVWKIGTREHDNGVILLLFIADRQARIEVGYGLEGRLTDALASRILRDELTPRLRAGDRDGGVYAAVQAIIGTITGEYTAPPAARGSHSSDTTWFVILFLLFFFGLPILRAMSGRGMTGGGRGWGSTRGPGGWGGLGGFGSGGGGGGGSWSSGGGSSWGGGGGGGFGGGGASGGW